MQYNFNGYILSSTYESIMKVIISHSISINMLGNIFTGRLIFLFKDYSWPYLSPDLTALDFFL